MAFAPEPLLLRAGDDSVTVIPSLGGKISSLRLAGREWLWTNELIPYRVPDEQSRADTTSYLTTADSGGYDECLPTISPCEIPSWVPAFGGLRLPDHGELWSQRGAVATDRDSEGEHAAITWVGRRLPYRFERTIRLNHDGRVTMHYRLTNTGAARLPFVWSAHPLLSLTGRTRVHLPTGSRFRVDATHALDVTRRSDHRWPLLPVAGADLDLSRPGATHDSYACKVFLDLPAGPVRAALEDDDARLDVAVDGREVPHFGLWINNGGWTPFEDRRPYRNLGFEPCIGAPDSLADALGEWNSAAWLEPGETRGWTLVWSAARA